MSIKGECLYSEASKEMSIKGECLYSEASKDALNDIRYV